MAENKKTKTDFKEALSAQASKLAPKKPSMETVKVDVGGEIVEIPRGDMTDEQWARVKQRAYKAPDAPERFSGDKLVVKTPQAGFTITREEQTDEEWQKLTDKVIKDYGGTNVTQHYTPPEERGRGEQWGEGTIFPDKGSYERLKSMPEGAEKKQELMRLKKAYDKKQTDAQEKSEEMSSAGPSGSTPMARMASMAQSAATGATPEENQKYINEYEQSKMVVPEEAKQIASAAEAVNPMNLAKKFDDTVTNAMSGVNRNVVGAAKEVGNALGVTDSTMPNAAPVRVFTDDGQDPNSLSVIEAQAAKDPGVDYDPATDPVEQAPVQPQPPVEQPGAQPNMAMSLAAQMPTGFKVEQADPAVKAEYDAARAGARAGIENAKETVEAAGIMRDGLIRKSAEQERMMQSEMAENARLASEAKQFGAQEMQRLEGARLKVVEEARRAAAEPTDPNRYWNNKTDGQKAMAVLAGALFGWGGQGMNWLQRLDGLVENDMRAQMADRNSRVQGLQAEAQSLGEAGQRALQAGATQAEAFLIEKQAKLEGLKSYLEMTSMRLSNVDQKAKAAEMLVALDQRSAALGAQAMDLASQEAARKTDANYKNALLRKEKFEAMLKVGGNGASGNRPLPEAGAKLMDDYSEALQDLREMQARVKNTGPGNRLMQKVAQSDFVPGNADEKAAKKAYDALKYKWMTVQARGALQGIEIAKLEDLLPERGQVMSDPTEQINVAENLAREQYDRAIRQQEQAGFDMSKYRQDPLLKRQGGGQGNISFKPSTR